MMLSGYFGAFLLRNQDSGHNWLKGTLADDFIGTDPQGPYTEPPSEIETWNFSVRTSWLPRLIHQSLVTMRDAIGDWAAFLLLVSMPAWAGPAESKNLKKISQADPLGI